MGNVSLLLFRDFKDYAALYVPRLAFDGKRNLKRYKSAGSSCCQSDDILSVSWNYFVICEKSKNGF